MILDAHLDLSMNALEWNRDLTRSIEEMARAAKERGYQYIAITDHSKSQAIANGLTPERLKEHIEAIRRAEEKVKGIRILAGSEVDILVDGRLDYEDAVLIDGHLRLAAPLSTCAGVTRHERFLEPILAPRPHHHRAQVRAHGDPVVRVRLPPPTGARRGAGLNRKRRAFG